MNSKLDCFSPARETKRSLLNYQNKSAIIGIRFVPRFNETNLISKKDFCFSRNLSMIIQYVQR